MSQPTLRREGDTRLTGASFKGGRRVESPPTFIRGQCLKNRNVWSTNFNHERFRSCFYTWEGISTPHVYHKGRQPLIKCAISCLQFVLFPLFYVLMFFMGLLYFLSFCGRQGCFPCSYISSIAMRKSDLRSSFRTKRWLSCFYLFLQDIF